MTLARKLYFQKLAGADLARGWPCSRLSHGHCCRNSCYLAPALLKRCLTDHNVFQENSSRKGVKDAAQSQWVPPSCQGSF